MEERVSLRMVKSARGCDQDHRGITCPSQLYEAGQEYSVSASLAKSFFLMGVAVKPGDAFEVQVQAPEPPVKPRRKSLKGAPENKGA